MVDWDKRYTEADAPLFGGSPNNYVVQMLARPDFAAASVLCLADGDGRNGRFLAGRDLDVTAVDFSCVATRQAVVLDEAAGVKVDRLTRDLATWVPAVERCWDAVCMIYLHCEREVRQRAVELAARHLTPGGWFVAEGFAAATDGGPRIGPVDPALLYDIGEFDRWLDGFELVEALAGTTRLQEGSKHRGLAQVVRYTARKT